MSFAENVKNELVTRREKLTCCRKAFVFGLFINSDAENPSVETENEALKDEIRTLIKEQFGKEPSVSVQRRVGHIRYILSVRAPSCSAVLSRIESGKSAENAVGFRCEKCRESFIRGAFLTSASVSDPLKSYHLEFRIKNAVRAKMLYSELSEAGFVPKIADRRDCVGLYYKGSEAIEDILTYIGASKMLFECMNDKILRDIRNDANRRANCETGNIAKSVGASLDVSEAIKTIREAGLFPTLSDELSEAAILREENPSASLSELCAIYGKPISKSGLAHRFRRIKDIAEEIKDGKL